MKKKIPQSYIDELLLSIDIVDVVKTRISVRKNNTKHGPAYAANCPFHDDDAHTLDIDTEAQQYFCPSCDIAGSAIGFIMYFDECHFIDAIQSLSLQCGMSLSGIVSEHVINEPHKKAVDLLTGIADYYQRELLNNASAISYLHERGITDESIRQFKIGYAPIERDYFDAIYPKNKTALIRAGVCGENTDKSYFARFRDRIMFPVRSADNEIVGFGGRSICDNGPKYLNSPASKHFSKSNTLFGLSHCIPHSKLPSTTSYDALVVEGYIDVVVAHQHGFKNTIAPLGTALTFDQIVNIKRAFRKVCFCFDGDAAGRAASRRALHLALPLIGNDFRVSFCLLPKGEDPDSLLTRYGKDELIKCINQAVGESAFLIDSHTLKNDVVGIGPVAALCAELRPHIQSITDSKLKLECIEALSEFSGVSLDAYM